MSGPLSSSRPGLSFPDATSEPFWLEAIRHQGISAFHPNPGSYQVFRNVKDFGAKGDGVTDDTTAIIAAMSTGDRCGNGNCDSSTITPAIVYFPRGTYLVSSPIETYYYTQIIGDAKNSPTILASPKFSGFAVIDADPYIPNGWGRQWFVNQNNFFRSVRNLVIDLRRMPASTEATGLHWQVSQATSLINIVVEMSTSPGNNHRGMFMENGSGGFMGDLVFNGGKYGVQVGNQQFTVRNITINNAHTAVYSLWNWGWTWQGVTINNCKVGFDLITGGTTQATQTVGAEAIIDAVVTNTPVFIRSSVASNGKLAGSLVLNNIVLNNVPTAVGVVGGVVVLEGGTTTIRSWIQGNAYRGLDGSPHFTQSIINPVHKSPSLLDNFGRIFGKTHPQYTNHSVTDFISVKFEGAKGDGVTDDTVAIQNVLDKYAGKKIIFFDAGSYFVTETVTIPPGSRLVGEAWSVIMGGGPKFQNQRDPQVVIRVGERNSRGVVEITDIIFSTVAPAAGAIVVEWNIRDPDGEQGAAGMWDSHIRIGGTAGTHLQFADCPAGSIKPEAQAAFMALHLTPSSSAYLEGTWVWVADHDLDALHSEQVTIFSGRGILSESMGPVWMIGTAEHFTLYQYNLANARDHFLGLIQTETPYYQPVPPAPHPFTSVAKYFDPILNPAAEMANMAWGLYVQSSQDIIVFGAGLYSFFWNYKQDRLESVSCQNQILHVDSNSTIDIYSLSTVGVVHQLSYSGKPVIHQALNQNGFAQTITLWSSQ